MSPGYFEDCMLQLVQPMKGFWARSAAGLASATGAAAAGTAVVGPAARARASREEYRDDRMGRTS
ncbi:hypothetical protein GCM10009837_39660 [Streptomyces durmitorensis]